MIPGDFEIGDYFVSDDTYAALSQYKVTHGDILISCVGTFGKIAFVPVSAKPGIINPRLIRVRTNELVTSQYLCTVLRSDVVFEQFSFLSRGGTMSIINIETLRSIVLVVPPVTEQTEILEFLDIQEKTFNGLIEQATKGVALLQERRSALISAAVTGKIHVRGWQPANPLSQELNQESKPCLEGL